MKSILYRRIFQYCEDNSLFEKGDRVVIGFSGGPDSVFLTLMLKRMSEEMGFDVFLAHLNHGIHDLADENERFAIEWADEHKLPIDVDRVPCAELSKGTGYSVEEFARRERYDYLGRACVKFAAGKIATGHNIDDQAETVLMRLIKGTGLTGLACIETSRKLSDDSDIILARPILDVSREEIIKFLDHQGVRYFRDPTNANTSYLRNKVRHELLSTLREDFNPNISESLSNLAQAAQLLKQNFEGKLRDYMEALEIGPDELFQDHEWYTNTTIRHLSRRYLRRYLRIAVDIKRLFSENPLWANQAVYRIMQAISPDYKKISRNMADQILKLLRQKENGKADLAGHITAAKEGDVLLFLTRPQGECDPAEMCEVAFLEELKPDETRTYEYPEFGFRIEAEVKPVEEVDLSRFIIYKKDREEVLDYHKVKFPLTLRTRRDGDRFSPLGLGHEKNLSDFLIDQKIPRPLRDCLPVAVMEGRPVWVPGLRIDESLKVTDDTELILHLRIQPVEDSEQAPENAEQD